MQPTLSRPATPPPPDPDRIQQIRIPPPPTDRVALHAWAAEHGVEAALSAAPPLYLARSLDGIFPATDARTMENLVVLGARGRGRWMSNAASTYLVHAAQIAFHQREVRAWALQYGGRPSSAVLVRLLERLEAHRALLDAVPTAVGPTETRPVQVLEEPLRLVVTESEPWTGSTRDVTLWLDEPKLRITCARCLAGRRACQVHQALALEAAIDFLHQPPCPRHTLLAALVETPIWARFLRTVDRNLADARPRTAAQTERRLVWRVRLDKSSVGIELVAQRLLKSGAFSKGSQLVPWQISSSDPAFRSPLDGPPLRMLVAAETRSYQPMNPTGILSVLLALVGHPRVVLAQEGVDLPVAVEVARLRLRLEDVDGAGVVPQLYAGPAPVDAAEVVAQAEPKQGNDQHAVAFDPQGGRILLSRVDRVARAIAKAMATQRTVFPPESYDELVGRFAEHAESFDLDLPAALDGSEVTPSLRLLVRLTPIEGTALEVELCARPIPQGPVYPAGEGPVTARQVAAGRRAFATRDLEAETRAAEALVPTLPLHDAETVGPFHYRILAEERALDLVLALHERAAELDVEWPADARMHVTRMTTSLRVEVTQKRDWFGLEGAVEVDGQAVTLAALLGAVRAGRRYVAVAPGRFAAIEQGLRQRLEAVEAVVFDGKHGLEVSPLAAAELERLVETPADLVAAASFRKLMLRIDAAKALEPKLPKGLTATLRHYQVEGFTWLARLASWGAGACLADDMGLGKTLQALALLLYRAKEGPALVIAPTSVGPNWLREAERFAPGLRVRLYRGAERGEALVKLGVKDVLVTSYAIATLDADVLARTRFATLVLDEAQAIKNAATRRARAVRSLQADVRVALTGTPVENHLGELWSLMRVLTPGLLGSWEQFRERFAGPIERTRSPARMAALARVVRPFMLRRTKAEVAPELPPRTELTRLVEPSASERALYEAARLAAVAAVATPKGEDARFLVLAWLTKLRRLACHPRLFDERSTVPSSKLAALLEVVEELGEGGHRALVFSQFTSHLALVREALDARKIRYEYLDGSTPSEERTRRVDAFQDGDARLFLISLKAGGTGINLTGADYVVHLDPWWNPAVEDQATDRAHRIGQTRAVTVVRLVLRGTIEEQVLTLHADKRALAHAVFDEEHGAPTKLTTSELAALLRWGAVVEDLDASDEEGDEPAEQETPRRR